MREGPSEPSYRRGFQTTFFKPRYRKSSATYIRLHLYMTRLGFPMNANGYSPTDVRRRPNNDLKAELLVMRQCRRHPKRRKGQCGAIVLASLASSTSRLDHCSDS